MPPTQRNPGLLTPLLPTEPAALADKGELPPGKPHLATPNTHT